MKEGKNWNPMVVVPSKSELSNRFKKFIVSFFSWLKSTSSIESKGAKRSSDLSTQMTVDSDRNSVSIPILISFFN